jgi:23S rRNA-/tRNA-specific pseudouridylate synthase
MRLDQAIAARFEMSRRKAREAIAAGLVSVDRKPVRIASREISDDSELSLWSDSSPQPKLLAITDEWLAVDKAVGLPTQPTRDRAQQSLEDILRTTYRTIYLVHRLDTPVSGVVLFARTALAAAKFSRLFANGEIRKTYLARVEPPIVNELTIATPVGGKNALTIVRPREGNLVEIEIKTGRKHQIRVHLSAIGHPVVGDKRYGGRDAARLMLHAWKLEHPEIGVIEAPSAIN